MEKKELIKILDEYQQNLWKSDEFKRGKVYAVLTNVRISDLLDALKQDLRSK